MSESSEKGRSLENYIAKTLQKKLGARVKRDGKSGAGSHQKMDISDYYRDTPLDIEAKNHKTIKLGEFWDQTVAGASMGRIPTLVVQLKDEPLAVLRFEDLVNFLVEIKDANATIADLRRPMNSLQVSEPILVKIDSAMAKKLKKAGFSACRNGHIIAEGQSHCLAKGCPYSAGYKAKKIKK
jgi:Holliday junction resolvase